VSNYTKSTDFAAKDALASGNAAKIVKGTEIDTEFNNIATAVATKADLASPTFTGTPALPTGTTAVTQSSGNNSTLLATTAFVQAAIALLYPVGSIYTNATSSTNPGTLLGFGTWVAFGAGRVMVGFDSGNALFDTAEETGGSADAITVSHTHTATVTDSGHRHELAANVSSGSVYPSTTVTASNQIIASAWAANSESYILAGTSTDATIGRSSSETTGVSVSNSTTGSSGTNANYQPYITVYMWKRTA
jgi:hypothetical protein